jgi:hypothetical protein
VNIMSINGLGVEREPPPVTLSRLRFLEQPEPENDTSRFATERVIRAGLESWEAITKAESFEGWKAIGKALAIGRDMALHSTGANAPMGRRYSAAFSAWINRHGFDRIEVVPVV